MQDEIVAQLANQLQVELIAVEAHRVERAPNPDSMDLYFQGRAILYGGVTPRILAKARTSYERALEMDPENVDALVETALVDFQASANYYADDPRSLMAAAEMKLTEALVAAPKFARAHYLMGWVLCATKRTERGVEEL